MEQWDGVISRISGKQSRECPNPSSPDWKSTRGECGTWSWFWYGLVFGVQCCFWVSGARLTATFRHIRVRSGYAEQIGFTLISYLLQPSGCRYAWFLSLLVAGAPCSNSATFNWRADRKSRIETATPVLTPAHKSQKQRQIKAFLLILRLGTLCVLCL